MPELKKDEKVELIKSPVVIGENVIHRMMVSDIELDLPAISIRDTRAELDKLLVEIIKDRVLLEGLLHIKIYYIGEDNIIHQQEEEASLNYFIEIPGAEPGMDIMLEPTVENVVSSFFDNGKTLQQKVVLQFFIKVLSLQQIMVKTGDGPLVLVDRVIGENMEHQLLKKELSLSEKVLEVVDAYPEVIELEKRVVDDRVIIRGSLKNEVFYIGEDRIEHYQTEIMPFNGFICIPGVTAEMNASVNVSVEHIKFNLSPDGRRVFQEILLESFAAVTDTVEINITTGDDSLLMLPGLFGENIGNFSFETTLMLDNSAVNIKDIQASFEDINYEIVNEMVIIHGVINKQLYYLGEDGLIYYQAENIPFTELVNINGARPGMKADIVADISSVKTDIREDGREIKQKTAGRLKVRVMEEVQFRVKEVFNT